MQEAVSRRHKPAQQEISTHARSDYKLRSQASDSAAPAHAPGRQASCASAATHPSSSQLQCNGSEGSSQQSHPCLLHHRQWQNCQQKQQQQQKPQQRQKQDLDEYSSSGQPCHASRHASAPLHADAPSPGAVSQRRDLGLTNAQPTNTDTAHSQPLSAAALQAAQPVASPSEVTGNPVASGQEQQQRSSGRPLSEMRPSCLQLNEGGMQSSSAGALAQHDQPCTPALITTTSACCGQLRSCSSTGGDSGGSGLEAENSIRFRKRSKFEALKARREEARQKAEVSHHGCGVETSHLRPAHACFGFISQQCTLWLIESCKTKPSILTLILTS